MKEILIDFTEKIIEAKEDKKNCPECGELPCVCGSRTTEIELASYPGENVERREDGVPKKKKKKRACKPGEHRDKRGKLVKNKKSKAYYSELWRKVNEETN